MQLQRTEGREAVSDIPASDLDEVKDDYDLKQAVSESDPVEDALEQYRAIVSRADNPGPYNVERDFIFHLIILDTPQTMELETASGDGFRSGTVSIINVSDDDGTGQYDGQHLIFSIDPSRTWWPGDTSLPLGEPRTNDIHILGIA